MSAWRIGTESSIGALGDGAGDGLTAIIDKLVKWIPGDTLAIYVPGVALIAAAPNPSPSWIFLIVMLFVNPLVIVGATFAAGNAFDRHFVAKLVLGTLAFAIWTLTVPSSGWQAWQFVANNPIAFTIGGWILGLLFGFVADGILKRLESTTPDGGEDE